MTFIRTLIAAALSLGAIGAASAQTATPNADKRQTAQDRRIDQGKASGQLTPAETKRLDAQQGRVDRVENRATADGTVTKAEKARGTHVENKASRTIRRQKHDRQTS